MSSPFTLRAEVGVGLFDPLIIMSIKNDYQMRVKLPDPRNLLRDDLEECIELGQRLKPEEISQIFFFGLPGCDCQRLKLFRLTHLMEFLPDLVETCLQVELGLLNQVLFDTIGPGAFKIDRELRNRLE